MKLVKMVEIGVVENHDEIREMIVFIINNHPGFHCTSYKSAEEAVERMKGKLPDIILIDINLPGMNGIECAKTMRKLYPQVMLLICTVNEQPDMVFNALKAGANGYILKKTIGEKLIPAINELLNGGAPMSCEIAAMVVKFFNRIVNTEKVETNSRLTTKENKILELIALGFGNKEIADKLFVSINTIRTHVSHIYEKLDVHSRVEALNKVKTDAVLK